MRAVSLPQPLPFALVHGGCDVLNMREPAPMPQYTMVAGTIQDKYATRCYTVPLVVAVHANTKWDGPDELVANSHSAYLASKATGFVDSFKNVDGVWWETSRPERSDGMSRLRGDFELKRPLDFNALVAVAEITGSHESTDCYDSRYEMWCSKWARGGVISPNQQDYTPMHHWVVGAVTALPNPIPHWREPDCPNRCHLNTRPDVNEGRNFVAGFPCTACDESSGYMDRTGVWELPEDVTKQVEAQL